MSLTPTAHHSAVRQAGVVPEVGESWLALVFALLAGVTFAGVGIIVVTVWNRCTVCALVCCTGQISTPRSESVAGEYRRSRVSTRRAGVAVLAVCFAELTKSCACAVAHAMFVQTFHRVTAVHGIALRVECVPDLAVVTECVESSRTSARHMALIFALAQLDTRQAVPNVPPRCILAVWAVRARQSCSSSLSGDPVSIFVAGELPAATAIILSVALGCAYALEHVVRCRTASLSMWVQVQNALAAMFGYTL